jgi:hypothetical protein
LSTRPSRVDLTMAPDFVLAIRRATHTAHQSIVAIPVFQFDI